MWPQADLLLLFLLGPLAVCYVTYIAYGQRANRSFFGPLRYSTAHFVLDVTRPALPAAGTLLLVYW
jgi:hypothetical protein